ncbi:hypothetical protein QE152_g15722 [Popillia japonica]|uniref:Reverse transcriptase domain-containing protein n=1 Tax=Popillia japonica TaxID=7064 RepID=A0AAW1L4X0_POPJA
MLKYFKVITPSFYSLRSCPYAHVKLPENSVSSFGAWLLLLNLDNRILYDGVLRVILPEGVSTIAYTDDLALLLADNDKSELQWKVNEAVEPVADWMGRLKVELAPHKTELVLLRGERDMEEIKVVCETMEIRPKKRV